MPSIQSHAYNSPEGARISCAQYLSQLLSAYNDQEVFLLASGGSALTVLNDINVAHLSSHVRMCVVDERFDVAKEDQNYYQLSQTDFARAFIVQGGLVCDTGLDDLDTLSQSEARFESHLESIARRAREGNAHVIALLGVGPDGHTAGIMPYPDDRDTFQSLFYAADRLAVGYDAGDKSVFSKRVTASASFLQEHVAHTVVYATGSDKADVLRDIIDHSDDAHVYPGRIVHGMKDVHIYTDQSQAGSKSF